MSLTRPTRALPHHSDPIPLIAIPRPSSSPRSVQDFMKRVSGGDEAPFEIRFDQFASFAVARERELLATFKRIDKNGNGFIGEADLSEALRDMGYRGLKSKDVQSMLRRIKTGRRPFSKGGGMLGDANDPEFKIQGRAIDFAEFRDFMLLSSARDLRDVFEVWGRAVLDLGDVDVSFPMSSGLYRKMKGETVRRPKKSVAKHLLAGGISGGVSRTVVAPLERTKIEYMVNSALAQKEGFVGTLVSGSTRSRRRRTNECVSCVRGCVCACVRCHDRP